MPANQRQQTAQSPTSSTFQSTAKYTNKDGSKFITIPKAYNSTDSSEPSSAMAQTTSQTNGLAPSSSTTSGSAPTVNRKKQKRRQKQAEQAARLAAGPATISKPQNGSVNLSQSKEIFGAAISKSDLNKDENQTGSHSDADEGDQTYYSEDDADGYPSYEASTIPQNGHAKPPQPPQSKAAKKKAKNKSAQNGESNASSQSALQPNQIGMSKEKIWNTSSQEERERIKMFWLSLGEEERRSLVKVEKDAVLKKMKEQQKHSCSCTVCGRKRVAIEEELEVLYDAYYEELEQYANHQQGDRPPPMMAGSRRFGAMGALPAPNRLPPAFNGRQPSRGKIVEHFGDEDDEEGDEGYSDEVDEEDYLSDEDPIDDISRGHATDFFNFGQSLTVQGGILTVADDLLKNDGKKFIEMMEQLAERRMAREEDAREQYHNTNGYQHPPNGNMLGHHTHHNHGPLPDDEEYDDEDEEEDDYDSQDEDYDEEEMDTMTEEQRMEEGRRMFQIFAARMFEQRVLTAYKEKVAAERQQKLLQELDEEDNAALLKKAKKAKEAAKKKEKAQAKKLALAEEKAKKEAEKAAEEAALRAEEAKKAEEARLKAEEKRKKREAQKKAEEEERLRKEAEKQRRLQEQRERQAEQERKAREAKEREKREKEEIRRKEREVKEAKEREAREVKERQEKEKKEQEMKAKSEQEAKVLPKREELGSQQPATNLSASSQTKRTPQSVPVPIPPTLQAHHNYASPHVPVATPAIPIPKAPTPNKPPTNSHRDVVGSGPQTPMVGPVKSQSASPNPSVSQSQQSSPGPTGQGSKPPSHPVLHHPQATSPVPSALKSGPTPLHQGGFPGMQPVNMNAFQQALPMLASGFSGRGHHDPLFPPQQAVVGGQFRPLTGPNGLQGQSGTVNLSAQQNRGFPAQPPPGFQQVSHGQANSSQPFDVHKEVASSHAHSRQHSASFENPIFDNSASASQPQPITRPTPIGRASSVVQGQHLADNQQLRSDIEDLSNHLGSSALLDDSDEPLGNIQGLRTGSIGRPPPFAPSYSMDPVAFTNPLSSFNTWGGPPNPFGGSSLPGAGYSGGWGNSLTNSFGNVGSAAVRSSQPRSVAVRLMLCRACKNLEGSSPDGFHLINNVRDQIERLNALGNDQISERELLDLCETEGNPNNGGGFFDIRKGKDGRIFIRHEPDIPALQRSVGAPGDIGSPVVGGNIQPVSRFPGPPGGF